LALHAWIEPRILQLTAQRIGAPQQFEVLLDAQHLHHGDVRPDRDPRAASLDAPQGHRGHARAFRDLGCSKTPAKPREAQARPELLQQALGDRE